MGPDERSHQIAGKFAEYVKSRDISLIEKFTEDEIEHTIIQYAREKDRGQAFYEAMVRRLEKLKDMRKEILSKAERKNERWHGRIEGTVGGIIVGVIVVIIGLIIQNHFSPQPK